MGLRPNEILVLSKKFRRLVPVSIFVTSKNAFREEVCGTERAKNRRLVKSVVSLGMLQIPQNDVAKFSKLWRNLIHEDIHVDKN